MALLCRATSETGDTQPVEHDPLHGGYVIQFLRPHTVRIVAAGHVDETAGDAASLLYDMAVQAEQRAHQRLDVEMEDEFADGAGI